MKHILSLGYDDDDDEDYSDEDYWSEMRAIKLIIVWNFFIFYILFFLYPLVLSNNTLLFFRLKILFFF